MQNGGEGFIIFENTSVGDLNFMTGSQFDLFLCCIFPSENFIYLEIPSEIGVFYSTEVFLYGWCWWWFVDGTQVANLEFLKKYSGRKFIKGYSIFFLDYFCYHQMSF